jgi:hypothetical protein
VVKAQKRLKQRFEPQGVAAKWVEFAFGPPLLEAANAGAIDCGYMGEAPPIFAQAAHAAIACAAAVPAGAAQRASPLSSPSNQLLAARIAARRRRPRPAAFLPAKARISILPPLDFGATVLGKSFSQEWGRPFSRANRPRVFPGETP